METVPLAMDPMEHPGDSAASEADLFAYRMKLLEDLRAIDAWRIATQTQLTAVEDLLGTIRAARSGA
jgi:hypothetical protein